MEDVEVRRKKKISHGIKEKIALTLNTYQASFKNREIWNIFELMKELLNLKQLSMGAETVSQS